MFISVKNHHFSSHRSISFTYPKHHLKHTYVYCNRSFRRNIMFKKLLVWLGLKKAEVEKKIDEVKVTALDVNKDGKVNSDDLKTAVVIAKAEVKSEVDKVQAKVANAVEVIADKVEAEVKSKVEQVKKVTRKKKNVSPIAEAIKRPRKNS